VVQESKKSFSKLFKHLVQNEKETENNWGNIALAAIEAYSKPFKYTHTLVFTIQFSQAKPGSQITFWTITMELPWGQVELCKNLLFLDSFVQNYR